MTATQEVPGNVLIVPGSPTDTATNIESALTAVTDWLNQNCDDWEPAGHGHLLLLESALAAIQHLRDEVDRLSHQERQMKRGEQPVAH